MPPWPSSPIWGCPSVPRIPAKAVRGLGSDGNERTSQKGKRSGPAAETTSEFSPWPTTEVPQRRVLMGHLSLGAGGCLHFRLLLTSSREGQHWLCPTEPGRIPALPVPGWWWYSRSCFGHGKGAGAWQTVRGQRYCEGGKAGAQGSERVRGMDGGGPSGSAPGIGGSGKGCQSPSRC